MASNKKTHLNLMVDPDIKRALEEQAAREGRSLGNIGEVLIKWSYERLETAGDSLRLLRTPKVELTKRVSLETQEQLYTALAIILRDAPSAVIEDAARYLESKAGKYGKEK